MRNLTCSETRQVAGAATPTLTTNQSRVAQEIVDFGIANSFTDNQIAYVMKVGMVESSLGDNLAASPPGVHGLFQYSQSRWDMETASNNYQGTYNGSHDVTTASETDQIRVMFSEAERYGHRYDTNPDNAVLPASKDDYLYDKHVYPETTDFGPNSPAQDNVHYDWARHSTDDYHPIISQDTQNLIVSESGSVYYYDANMQMYYLYMASVQAYYDQMYQQLYAAYWYGSCGGGGGGAIPIVTIEDI